MYTLIYIQLILNQRNSDLNTVIRYLSFFLFVLFAVDEIAKLPSFILATKRMVKFFCALLTMFCYVYIINIIFSFTFPHTMCKVKYCIWVGKKYFSTITCMRFKPIKVKKKQCEKNF